MSMASVLKLISGRLGRIFVADCPDKAPVLGEVAGTSWCGPIPRCSPRADHGIRPEGCAHAALYAARDLPKHKDDWNTVLRSIPMARVVLLHSG